jgi:hypothetical protein
MWSGGPLTTSGGTQPEGSPVNDLASFKPQVEGLKVPGAQTTLNGRCVGVLVNEDEEPALVMLWNAAGCEHVEFKS